MSLSKRLRDAEIERSRLCGYVIDSCVLGPDGVIDLRALDDSGAEWPSTRPAAALADTIGGFDNDIDVSDLYCERAPHRFAPKGYRRPW